MKGEIRSKCGVTWRNAWTMGPDKRARRHTTDATTTTGRERDKDRIR